MVNDKFDLDKSFLEISYRIDNWINEGSGWLIESINGEYVNVSGYSPLMGSTYIELPNGLKNVMKGLINIKNNYSKCFLWCHIRHLNIVKTHPERIAKVDKNMIYDLNYEGIKFLFPKKIIAKLKDKIMFALMCSVMKMDWLILFMYVFLAYPVCKCCLQCLSSEKILIQHKENCLVINGKQSAKLKSGSYSFKNYFKQLPVPFKIYGDFECILKGVKSSDKNNGSNTEKYQAHIPCSFAYKIVCVDNKFSKKVVLCKGKNVVYRSMEAILEEYNYCRRIIKTYFNKNLVMSAEEEERFQLTSSYWICDKLFDVGDNKVRDNCHITGKYRGVAHWSCNINLELTKKNIRGYDSNLIIEEISKFYVKVSVTPNGLEKYMAFTINKNLVFIDSMQFMNSRLDSLVKNLSDNDFKYLF